MADENHRALLRAAHHGLASDALAFIRNGRLETDFSVALEALLDDSGVASFHRARRESSYTSEEARFVGRHLGYLAAHGALVEARPILADFMRSPIPVGSESEIPSVLLSELVSDASRVRGGALAAALEPLASRFVEIRSAAVRAWRAQAELFRIEPSSPLIAAAPDRDPRPTAAGAGRALPPSAAEWAEQFLAASDDAAHEMVQWLTRAAAPSGKGGWPALAAALRASAFDGLAKPTRRLFRVSEGARRLGFERDMNSRIRPERSITLLAPRSVCIALSVPRDLRLTLPSLESGVLSDLAAARALGEGLALALVSPALSEILARPVASGISAGIGALFLQLRSDRSYLARIDGLSPDIAERLARHAAVFLLLQARLSAAIFVVEQQTQSERERLLQLMAAAERALGCALPAGVIALAALVSGFDGSDCEADACGLAAHAALRERFDEDWFLNPRVSEVLRGACARGNLLDGRGFCAELGAAPDAAIERALELVE